MDDIDITHSQVAAEALLSRLISAYALPANTRCCFYTGGLHDNYRVETGNTRYICRIYRPQWRDEAAVNFELAALEFIGRQTRQVAAPIQTTMGESCLTIACPEGTRQLALFRYAEGEAPMQHLTREQSEQLGHTVARIHQLSDNFHTHFQRPPLELSHLVDESLLAIQPFIEASSQHELAELQQQLHTAMPNLSRDDGHYGFCIGDVNSKNFHIDSAGNLCLFDFDQCGFGFRVFEIGKYFASIHGLPDYDTLAQAFLDAYQQQRRLSPEEHAAIPLYQLAAMIWGLGIHAWNVDRIGYHYLEPPFWQRRIQRIREQASILL